MDAADCVEDEVRNFASIAIPAPFHVADCAEEELDTLCITLEDDDEAFRTYVGFVTVAFGRTTSRPTWISVTGPEGEL